MAPTSSATAFPQKGVCKKVWGGVLRDFFTFASHVPRDLGLISLVTDVCVHPFTFYPKQTWSQEIREWANSCWKLVGVLPLTSKRAESGSHRTERKMLVKIYKHNFLFIFLLPNFIISVSWTNAMGCCSVVDLQ